MRDSAPGGHGIRRVARWPIHLLLLTLALGSAFAACSLEGLSGGVRPVDAGPESGAADGSPADAAGDPDPGPCPGCEVLASGEEHPTEIALLADRLFWLRDATLGHVVGSRSDGGDRRFEEDHAIANPHDLIASAREEAYAVASDGTMKRYLVYSTCMNATGVRRLASLGTEFLLVKDNGLYRGDCGGNQLLATESITAVAGDGSFAWYARTTGEIVRCDVSANGCAASRTVLATGQGAVAAIAHDATRVFWIPSGSAEIRSRLKSAAGSPGDAETFATGLQPKALAPTGGEVYWTDIEAGHVVRTRDGTSTVIARGLQQPWGITTDTRWVYFTESGAGQVRRLPR
jgi:hypothetical protein